MIFFELFYTFLIIGLFTFGGGYSMVALIQDEVVQHHGWMTPQEFTDMLAISQMTPGPIGINTATFAGYSAAASAGYGPWLSVCGALVASLAVIALPMGLMLAVCRYLASHMQHPAVASIMRVLRMAVVGLIAAAALGLVSSDSFGTPGLNVRFLASLAIFCAVFWASYKRLASPILLIVASGIAGWLLYGLAGA